MCIPICSPVQAPRFLSGCSLFNRLLASLCLVAFATWPQAHLLSNDMSIQRSDFGQTPAGQKVDLYTLKNRAGHSVRLTNYGAIIVSIDVPDRAGTLANVTAGFDSLAGYLDRHPYFGATVGRFCNRIAKGKFSLDGKEYSLAINNGPNHLHGGEVGFDKLVWSASELKTDQSVGIRFTLLSPDGQEGYPGNLNVTADYLWDDQSTLTIHFSATTDKATVLNFTNHAYFNLAGPKSGPITDHQLSLACTKYLTIDADMIPTGAFANVEGTPLDFRAPHAIGERIAQLTATNGYDHCFVIDGTPGSLRPVATVFDPKSGRAMEVQSTEVGVQLYTGNFLNGSDANAGYGQHQAFCLETQHFPNSPNQADFPTTTLKPGETFQQTSTFRFFVKP